MKPIDPIAAAHLRVLEDLRRQVLETVAPLDDEQINRQVEGLRNTAGIVLRHLAGSERYWVGEVVGGRPAHRHREVEFGHERLRKDDLLAEIDRVASLTRDVLGGLSSEGLAQEVEVPRVQGAVKETKAWAVAHATQHLAYHLGQLRYLTKLLETTKGRQPT